MAKQTRRTIRLSADFYTNDLVWEQLTKEFSNGSPLNLMVSLPLNQSHLKECSLDLLGMLILSTFNSQTVSTAVLTRMDLQLETMEPTAFSLRPATLKASTPKS